MVPVLVPMRRYLTLMVLFTVLFLHYFLINFVLNSHPRLRILDNPLRIMTSQWLVLLRLPIQWYNMVPYEKVPVPLPEPQNGIST